MAVDHWRSYLVGNEFIIRTDQRSLVHLDDQRLTTPWQQKALTKLLGLWFRIHKKGLNNQVANALSRLPSDHIMTLSTLQPTWLSKIADSYNLHEDTMTIL